MNSSLLFFFYFFSGFAIFSTVLVILSVNSVYSALFLILVFFNTACTILLLDLEFLSLIFILIYIGAIMVLVLFIIMMLDIKFSKVYLNMYYYFFLSGVLLLILVSEFFYFFSLDFPSCIELGNTLYLNWYNLVLEPATISVLGTYLYTDGSFFFLISGLILLIAMIGSISLTLKIKGDISQHYQFLFNQVNTKPKKSIFYVKDNF